jgi:hypothetical protein
MSGFRCLFVLFLLPGLILLGSSVFAGAPSPAKGNRAIREFEPALAVRAPACITCHAKIRSSIITDFGHGNPVKSATLGSFSGSIYGDFFGGEPNKTAWLTAEIEKPIVVPDALFDFNLMRKAG